MEEEWRKVSADFQTDTRAFRAALEKSEPDAVRKAAVNLQRTCNACHTKFNVR